jgi:hypothetical protein
MKINKIKIHTHRGGGFGGLGFRDFLNLLLCTFRGAGGGKCPEEEHTTCSGGRTNCNLSQARFTGRENIFIKYKSIL